MKISFIRFTASLFLIAAPSIASADVDYNARLDDLDPKVSKARIVGTDESRQLIVETKTAEGIDRQVFQLEVLPKGWNLFHWTSEENQKRWLATGGKIDAGEISFLSTPSGERQAYGPGWYVSESPVDSKSFGVKAVMTTMPDDITVLRGAVTADTPEKAGRTLQKLRELGILGTHVRETWFTFFDAWPASKLSELTLERALDALTRPGAPPINKGLAKELIEAFGLRPHPFFDKHFPSLAKLMRGESLDAAGLAQLRKDFFPYVEGSPVQKQLWGYLSGADRLTMLKKMVPPKPGYLNEFMSIETKLGGLPPAKDLASSYPDITKLLSGAPLTGEERVRLRTELEPLMSMYPSGGSQVASRLREEFAPELRRYYISYAANSLGNGYSRESTIEAARGWGVPISALVDGAKDVGRYPDPGMGEAKEIQKTLKDFGKKFIDAYQYIGEADLTVAAVQGNAQPWARYDEPGQTPLSERWDNAMKVADDATPLERASVLAGKPVQYRDHPITAGGDIFLPGQKEGYFRATPDEVNAMKANPFLKVRTVADPWPQSEAYKTVLARYDYASPSHYQQFAEYLPEDLVAELKAAELAGELVDTASATYKDLCRRMVEHLSTNMDKGADTALEKYVRRISVHPFDDMNGRFARLSYAKEQSEPLTMRHWNLDILTTPEELVALRDEGRRQHLARILDLKAMEAKDPNFPRYFEAPEIFEGFFHSPVSLGDKDAHRAAMKDFFRNPEHLDMIRKKEMAMLEWRAWDMEIDRLLGLPKAERDAALVAWARANLRPEPRTRARFEALLDASREAAKAGSPAREVMARWWLDLSTGDNPAYADSLAKTVQSLPADLKNAFLEERFANRVAPTVDLGNAFNNDLVARAEARLKGPAGAGRQDAAVFLIDREAGNKGNLSKALLRFAKDPEGSAILKQALGSPSANLRTEAAVALVDLPRNTLGKDSRAELMRVISTLPEKPRIELAYKLVSHPDHWLANDAWKAIAMYSGEGEGEMGDGGPASLSNVMKDKRMKEKLFERMKKDPRGSVYWQQLAYSLGDDGMLEQQKMYKAMADAKAWKTFAGLLDAQASQLEYLLSGETEADSTSVKLSNYLKAEIPKMIEAAPEHMVQGNLALRALAQDPEEKARLSFEALDGLPMVGANDRRKVMDRLLEIARSAANGEGAGFTMTDLFKQALSSGPDTTKLFFSKLKTKDYALIEKAGPAMKNFANLLLTMNDEAERIALLKEVLLPKGAIGPLLIAEVFENDYPGLRATFGKLLADPAFSHNRWSILALGLEDPKLGPAYLRSALASRGVKAISDAEVTELAKAAKAITLRPSTSGLFGSQAAKASLEQRLALLQEFDASAPRDSRLAGNEKFQTAMRAELKKPNGNTLEALAFVEKRSEDAWDAINRSLKGLGANSKPTLAEAIAIMNRSVAGDNRITTAGITDLLSVGPKLKGLEEVPYLELLGKTRDLDPTVLKYLGERLLANDPGISDAAARALANLSLQEKGSKDLVMAIVKEYIAKKGGAREKLSRVFHRAGINYAKEIEPLEKARDLALDLGNGKGKPCADWFRAWGI